METDCKCCHAACQVCAARHSIPDGMITSEMRVLVNGIYYTPVDSLELMDQNKEIWAMEEMVAVDSESIVIDSEVTLAGAEIEVETMDGGEVEAEEVVGDDGGRIVGSKVMSGMKKTWGGKSPFGMLSSTGIDLMEEEEDDNEESDLSRFAHDHAYTFSKPTNEPSPSPR